MVTRSPGCCEESFLRPRQPERQYSVRLEGAIHGGLAFQGASEYKTVYTVWPKLA